MLVPYKCDLEKFFEHFQNNSNYNPRQAICSLSSYQPEKEKILNETDSSNEFSGGLCPNEYGWSINEDTYTSVDSEENECLSYDEDDQLSSDNENSPIDKKSTKRQWIPYDRRASKRQLISVDEDSSTDDEIEQQPYVRQLWVSRNRNQKSESKSLINTSSMGGNAMEDEFPNQQTSDDDRFGGKSLNYDMEIHQESNERQPSRDRRELSNGLSEIMHSQKREKNEPYKEKMPFIKTPIVNEDLMSYSVSENYSDYASHQNRLREKIGSKCPLCNAVFSHHHDMKRHQKTKHGEFNYVCSHCQKNFSRKDALKRHMQSHG